MNNIGCNLLFYSVECDTSRNLIRLLKNEQLLCFFKTICIDNNFDRIPPQITIVPTLFVKSENRLYAGPETFEWVKKIKFIKQNSMDVNKSIIQQNLKNMTNNNMDGPLGFKDTEMNAISDSYAYDVKSNADNPLPQSFFGVNDSNKHVIFTPPGEKVKLSKNEQVRRIQDLESIRDQESADYYNKMKDEQIRAVISAETGNIIDFQQQIMQQKQFINNQQIMQQHKLQNELQNVMNKEFHNNNNYGSRQRY